MTETQKIKERIFKFWANNKIGAELKIESKDLSNLTLRNIVMAFDKLEIIIDGEYIIIKKNGDNK